jgi:uncharacterized protein
MSPKIQLYKDATEKTRFRIRADNNRIVATGEAYEQYTSAINGIRSIQKNCKAPIEDLTIESGPKVQNPKYQIYKDTSGEFRFRLKAANGEIIAQGEGYESKDGALNGIDVIRRCDTAEIEDPHAKKTVLEPDLPVENETPKPPPVTAIITQVKTEAPMLHVEDKEAPLLGPVDTVLDFYPAPANIAKGEKTVFSGKLYRTNTNKGISDAKIRIWEKDRSILGNDYLAFGKTTEDGSFTIFWKARPLAWRKNTGNIFAEFNGNEKAKPSKSAIQTITIT